MGGLRSSARDDGRGDRWFVVLPFLLLYVGVVMRSAWMMDDAYISFRSVDNWIHGYGLRWNTFERVDAFTNPLWTMLLGVFAAVTREVYYTATLLQVVLSTVAVWLLSRMARTTLLAAGSLAVVSLCKSFVDYSTSGLENALSHLLLVLFAGAYLSGGEPTVSRLRSLALLGSLALVDRLDFVWIVFPCLAETTASLLRGGKRPRVLEIVRALAIGLLPVVAWESFSLFYYGALIPNSALAKLTSRAPRGLLLWHGLSYYRESFVVDPITLLVVAIGLGTTLARGSQRTRTLALGIVGTLAYILRVGGDHMSGRFFTVPFLAAVILLVQLRTDKALPAAVGATSLAAAWMAGFPTLNDQYVAFRGGTYNDIEDYRREWYPFTGLLSRSLFSRGPDHDWVHTGKASRAHPDDVPIWGGVGFGGYYAGPEVRIIDMYGLANPLLARLAIPDAAHQSYFKMGHFLRAIPDGYVETVHSGVNRIRHPALHLFYDKLAFITQGPLWSIRRLLEVAKMNAGAYSQLLEEYVSFQDAKPVDATALPPASSAAPVDVPASCPDYWNPCATIGVSFTRAGVRVKLAQESHAQGLTIQVDAGNYVAVYWRDYREIERARFDVAGSGRVRVEVPSITAGLGYDAVTILPQDRTNGGTLTLFQEEARP